MLKKSFIILVGLVMLASSVYAKTSKRFDNYLYRNVTIKLKNGEIIKGYVSEIQEEREIIQTILDNSATVTKLKNDTFGYSYIGEVNTQSQTSRKVKQVVNKIYLTLKCDNYKTIKVIDSKDIITISRPSRW